MSTHNSDNPFPGSQRTPKKIHLFKNPTSTSQRTINFNCEDGYELNEEQTQCKACKNGYTSHGDTCFKEIEYCEKYEDEEKTCSRCEEGYELYQNGLQCIEKCESDSQIKPFDECIDQIENCEVYKQDKTCEKCSDYFKLDNNKCVYCEDKIGDGKKCYDRIDGCIEQKENKCKKCNINYKISEDGTQCIKCPDNQISGGVTKQCYHQTIANIVIMVIALFVNNVMMVIP